MLQTTEIFFVIVLDIKNYNLKPVWDLLLRREIPERNIPTDAINKNIFKSSDIFSSMVKRTKTSLTPYESVGK